MAQFTVPQFIDFESKIVGPLTLKQFAFVALPALICFFLFFVLNLVVWILVTIVLLSIGATFAFIKIGGRPLYMVALYGLKFFWEPKLFLWRRPLVLHEAVAIPSVEHTRQNLKDIVPDFSKVGKLFQDLTTTKNPIPKREKTPPRKSIQEIQEQYQVLRRITGEREVARRIDYR